MRTSHSASSCRTLSLIFEHLRVSSRISRPTRHKMTCKFFHVGRWLISTRYLDPIGTASQENSTNWAAYAIHEALFSIFENTISNSYVPMIGYEWEPSDGLGMAGTKLVEKTPWPKPNLPLRNFRELIEELSAKPNPSLSSLDSLSYSYLHTHTPRP